MMMMRVITKQGGYEVSNKLMVLMCNKVQDSRSLVCLSFVLNFELFFF